MKIVIFLLAVSFNQLISGHKVDVEGSLKAVEGEIKELKAKIEDDIRDLNRYRNALEINFDNEMESRKKEDVKSILTLIKMLLEKIDRLVCNASINGKGPNNCYEWSQVATRAISIKAYTSLNECTKEAKQFIEQVRTNIDKIISTGQSLTASLDRIFQDCYSHIGKKMLRCVNREAKKLEISVKSFQSSAHSIKTTGYTAFHQGYLRGVTCYNDVLKEVQERGQEVLASAENCIADS